VPQPCHAAINDVQIETIWRSDIAFGKSICNKKQLEEYATFQYSQAARKAYFAETAELGYGGRNEEGEWGLALGGQSQPTFLDFIDTSFIPMSKVVVPFSSSSASFGW
jgi:hypothetical protein